MAEGMREREEERARKSKRDAAAASPVEKNAQIFKFASLCLPPSSPLRLVLSAAFYTACGTVGLAATAACLPACLPGEERRGSGWDC